MDVCLGLALWMSAVWHSMALNSGSSVIGWVEAGGLAAALEQCEVELEPVSAGGPPRLMEGERAKLRSRTLLSDARGFFHFSGVEPGAYRLTARHPAFAPATLEGLAIPAGAEVRLPSPIVLRPASRLEVWISPATDPEGEPWRLELWKRGASGGLRTPVTAKPEPAPDGHWLRPGLAAGRHWLRVLDERGQAFALRELDVSPDDPPLFVTLDPTPIEGALKLGGEPIAGSIYFGGRRGSESVRVEANEEGAFSGTLPRSGSWVVEIVAKERKVDRWLREVHVRALEGGGPAHIALNLPATTLTGRVLRESGAPAAGARVTIVRGDEAAAPILLAAGDDGRFETAGAAPGDYQVEAEGEEGEADPISLSLDERRQSRGVELILRPRRELSGRLVFGDAGVRAARVTALPLLGGLEPFTSPQLAAVSDEQGAFSLKLPRWADGVELVVEAPGFALRQIRLHPLPEDAVAIPLAQDGGTLQWTIQGGFSPQSPADAMPTLYGAAGMALSLALLRDWSNLHGIQTAEMGELAELTIPNLEPGTYTACWFETREAGWSAARNGQWPKSRCSSVTLSAFGAADLVVKAPNPNDAN